MLRSKVGSKKGITFYSDFKDENQFWYIPEDIHFAEKDGIVQFSLIEFSGDRPDQSGGYLNMEVNMDVKKSTLDAAFAAYKQEIGYGGPGNLSLVPFDAGTVQFVVLEGENKLGKMLDVQSPSLIGKNSAIFSAKLNPTQSQIMEAVFQDAAAPAAVYYTLTYSGIVDSLSVEVTADFDNIYTGLEAVFGLSVISLDPPISLSTKLNAVIELLETNGDLTIKTVKGEDPPQEVYDWVMDFVKEEILKSFFTASLENSIPENNDKATPSSDSLLSSLFGMLKEEEKKKEGGGGEDGEKTKTTQAEPPAATPVPIPALSLDIKLVRREEYKTFNLNFDLAVTIQRTVSPQSFLGTETLRIEKKEPYYLKVKLDDPFFSRMNLNILGPDEYDKIGLKSATAALEYAGRAIPPDGVKLFTKGDNEAQVTEISREENIDTPINIIKTFVFSGESGILGQSQVDVAVNTLVNTISLNPSDFMSTVEIPVMPFLVDFDKYPMVQVIIHYTEPSQDTQKQIYTFKKTEVEDISFKYRQDKAFPWDIAYEIKYYLKKGATKSIYSEPGAEVDGILIPSDPPEDAEIVYESSSHDILQKPTRDNY